MYSSNDNTNDVLRKSSTFDNLKYGLVVEAEPSGDQIRLKTTFDSAKMSIQQAEIIHQQLDELVKIFVQDQSTNIDDLWDKLQDDLLAVSEVKLNIEPLPELTSSIKRMAQQDPDKAAVSFISDFEPSTGQIARTELTYKDLHNRSMYAAHCLIDTHGLVADDIIAIWTPKSIEMYVLICAALEAGIAYLCIDTDTPIKRVCDIVRQAQVKTLIVDQSISQKHHWNIEIPMVLMNHVLHSENRAMTKLHSEVNGSNLAYAVFTSGSTGTPKGVLITRDNLMNNVQHLAKIYPHNQESRMLQSCSPAFDVSAFEIFWTWHCGLTLVSAVNDVLFRDLEAFINATKVTHLSMTPSVAALINPKLVPEVKFLVCSGEPMSARVFEVWKDHGLYQGYGPSETTNICNVRDYRRGTLLINNVGPAFPSTSIFVCAKRRSKHSSQPLQLTGFRLLPKGAVGEIWIGGRQVGRGYTDDKLTAQSWLEHPKHGRLYRSGDLGRLLADGSLVILGREDDQAKLRGQRIELNDINTSLMQSGLVGDAYTMILSDESAREKLVSFCVGCVLGGRAETQTESLFNHLHESLPAYMIPELLIPLSKLPLTHQSKVDRGKLVAIHAGLTTEEQIECSFTPSAGTALDASSDEVKKVVAALSSISGIPATEINPHASLFTYGIDSIRAVSFTRTLKAYGCGLFKVSTIMKHPSASRLAAYLAAPQDSSKSPKNKRCAIDTIAVSIKENLAEEHIAKAHLVKAILPCTPLQEAMLASSEAANTGTYLNHLTYRLRQDASSMRRAWSLMIRRHDILRTFFATTMDDSRPYVQIVLAEFGLPWIDSDSPKPSCVASPFKNPPYSLQSLKGSHGTELHLFMHHALYDAEALAILQTEVEMFCYNETMQEPVAYSRYLDFMVSMNITRAIQFWKGILDNVTPSRLSDVVGHSSLQSSARSMTKLCDVRWKKLVAVAKRCATTPLVLLQVSLIRLLARCFEADDICIGTVLSGRNVDVTDVERIVGPCFNTLPTRVKLKHKTTNLDLFQILQKFNIEVLTYQPTSLRQLQRDHSPDGRPLFDVLLLLQAPKPNLNTSVWELTSDSGQMVFPFIFEVQPDASVDRIQVTLHTQSTHMGFNHELLHHSLEAIADTVENTQAAVRDGFQLSQDFRNFLRSLESHGNHANGHANGNAIEHWENVLEQTFWDTDAGQALLRALPETALKQRHLSEDTTIFHLGLDSINVLQIAARLRSSGFPLTGSDLLEHPRLSDIVNLCGKQNFQRTKNALVPNISQLEATNRKHRRFVLSSLHVQDEVIDAIWPCTATQNGILSEYIKSSGKLYWNKMRLQLDDNVDLKRLQRTWIATCSRHIMLRTGFVAVDDNKTPFLMVVYSDSSSIRGSMNVDEVAVDAAEDSRQIHDISKPPWSLRLISRHNKRFVELQMLHALYDAHSIRIVLHDLALLYRGKVLPSVAPIPPALASIIGNNQSEDYDKPYWSSLESVAQQTKFPDLNIERNIPSKLNVCFFELSASSSDIQDACEQLNCSLSIACQIVWAKLLAAYTGQQNVNFGVIVSGRSFDDESYNEVVFPCMNTVPVVFDLSSKTASLLEQATRASSVLHKNPHLPLSKVRRSLNVEGDLFDTVLVLQKSPSVEDREAPWSMVSDEASAEYAVSLEIIPCGDIVSLQITYNQNLLPVEHARLLLEQYQQMLYEMLDLQRSQIGTHRNTLVSQAAAQEPRIPSEHISLHEMVLARAALITKKIAIEFVTRLTGGTVKKQTWTYNDLVAEATRIANLLLSKGAQTADLVAICFDKCPQASIALLGVLMAGCGYVAIDPSAPSSRRDFILQDARCEILLTTSNLCAQVESRLGLTVLCIDDAELLSSQSTTHPQLSRPVRSDDICYCLYTSGTTGTPKGCLISHNSVVQSTLCFSRLFVDHWTEDSRWLQFAAYHFDVSVLEHFWTWSEGLCVTIVPRDVLFEDLPGTINRLGITHLDLTPSLARLLTPESTPSLCRGVFVVGGEEVRHDIIDIWGDAACLYNFYGPSECTTGSIVHPRVRKGVKPTNIGWQWDNVGSYVLKPDTEEPVLVGAVGELCLSGALVGVGYLNRPELTAEKFVILKSTGERVYRTGDLVRMLHDMSFEFLGRIDAQVKLRGQRLEAGEINHVISQATPTFSDVSTLVLKHPEQEKDQLVAFLAREKNTRNKIAVPRLIENSAIAREFSQARREVIEHLPSYMVPTYFLLVNFLPLTVNNKVDAKALKAMYESLSLRSVRDHQKMQNSTSAVPAKKYEQIREIVKDYLHIAADEVSPESSLLQLGLDSISAIGLSRKLKGAGYPTASVATIMRHPIVDDLVLMIQENDDDSLQNEAVAARRRIASFEVKHKDVITKTFQGAGNEIEHIYPCTPLQEGMISRLMSTNSTQLPYLTKVVYRLGADVEFSTVKRAWDELKLRLDILRTRFIPTEEGYAQVILNNNEHESSCNIEHDVDVIKDDALTVINGRFEDWIESAKELSFSPPWQVWLTQRSQGGFKYMSLFMFHGIYDGASLSLLLDVLSRLCRNPRSTVSYGPQFTDALSYGPLLQKPDAPQYWKYSVQRVALLDLQAQHDQSKLTRYIHRLDGNDIRRRCKALAVTSQAVFQAAWLYTLAQVSGINPTIGVVLSGRTIDFENADKVIGPMFNTLPFTVSTSADVSLTELVKACHEKNVRMLPFHHTSLSDIAKWLELDLRKAVFDSLFVFQNRMPKDQQYSEWPWVEMESASLADYPLNIEIEEVAEDEFIITIVATISHLGPNKISTLLHDYVEVLSRVADASETPLSAVFWTADHEKGKEQQPTEVEEEIDVTNLDIKDLRTIRAGLALIAGVDEASVDAEHTTIFELGLDSVDALKLAAKLKNMEISLPVSKILQHPTSAGMAHQWLLQKQQDIIGRPGLPHQTQDHWRLLLQSQGLNLSNVEAVTPVTSMQEGLLLEYEKYLNIFVHKLQHNTDPSLLIEAIHKCVCDLPILRTSFVTLEEPAEDVAFLQIVQKARTGDRKTQISLEFNGIEALKSYTKNLKTNASIKNSVPHIEAARLEDGTVFLVSTMSHAHYDAWSLRLIFEHMQKCYDRIELAPRNINSILVHVEEIRMNASDQKGIDFWSGKLSDASPTLSKASEKNAPPSLHHLVCSVPTKHLHNFCKQSGITLQSLGLTTCTLASIHLTSQSDVCFGQVVSGRTSEDAERLVFPTFNTVVFRPQVDTHASKQETLESIHELSVAIYEHQHFPLSQALKLIDSHRGDAFNMLFTFNRRPGTAGNEDQFFEEVRMGDFDLSPPYPVNIEMEEKQGGLLWTISVQAGICSPTQVEETLRLLDHILGYLVTNENTEIFSFKDGMVSICELPSIELHSVLGSTRFDVLRSAADQEIGNDTWSATEQIIRTVFARVAAIEENEISKDMSLFHLGLDSVSAIKITKSLRIAGLKTPVSVILKEQTIAKIAAVVAPGIYEEELESSVLAPVLDDKVVRDIRDQLQTAGVAVTDIEAILPVTAGQEYMLDMWRASNGQLFYATFWLEVENCTKESFSWAITRLIQEVPLLRTKFINHDSSIFQVVFRAETQCDGPWQYQVQTHDDHLVVSLHIHHALYDAVSLNLMTRRLQDLCQGHDQEAQPLSDMRPFFAATMARSNSDRVRKFWVDYLPDVSDKHTVLGGTLTSKRNELFATDLISIGRLEQVARHAGLSVQAIFFAVVARIRGHMTAHDGNSIVLGIYLANRSLDIASITNLIAPTCNIVPMKVDVSLGVSLLESARKVQEGLFSISKDEHCGIPLRDVYAWTGVKIDCYVNFLKLPDNDATDKVGHMEDMVTMKHASGEARDRARGMSFGDGLSPFIEGGQGSGEDLQWCTPSLDIEARIQLGQLSMGLFAPKDMLDDAELMAMMNEVKEMLEGITN